MFQADMAEDSQMLASHATCPQWRGMHNFEAARTSVYICVDPVAPLSQWGNIPSQHSLLKTVTCDKRTTWRHSASWATTADWRSKGRSSSCRGGGSPRAMSFSFACWQEELRVITQLVSFIPNLAPSLTCARALAATSALAGGGGAADVSAVVPSPKIAHLLLHKLHPTQSLQGRTINRPWMSGQTTEKVKG